nr:oxidoreductase [Neobacillus sp. Marseille-Q6967]
MNHNKKNALILGATGLIGKELVKILIKQKNYEKIHLLVRRPVDISNENCDVHVVDFDNLHAFQELFKVSDVFCTLGTTIKKAKTQEVFRKVDYEYPIEAAKLAKEKGVEKFLIVTAMGADTKSRIFYNRVKGEVEASLIELDLPSLHIFRPSLLLGEREEFRLGEKIAEKASKLLNILMIGPLRPYRAIQGKTVAAAMAAVSNSRKSGINVYRSHEIEKMLDTLCGRVSKKITR